MAETVSELGVSFSPSVFYNYTLSGFSKPQAYPVFSYAGTNNDVLGNTTQNGTFFKLIENDGKYVVLMDSTSGYPANRYVSKYHDLWDSLPSSVSSNWWVYFDAELFEESVCGSIGNGCSSLKVFAYDPIPKVTTDSSQFSSYTNYNASDTSSSRNFYHLIPKFSYEVSDSGSGSIPDPDPSVPSTFDDSGIVSAILMIPAAIIVLAFFSMIIKMFLNRRIIN